MARLRRARRVRARRAASPPPAAAAVPLAPPPSSAAAAFGPARSSSDVGVRTPFCWRRCYWAFSPLATTSGDRAPSMEQYVDVLCREIAATPLAPSSRSRRAATADSEKRSAAAYPAAPAGR